MADERPAPDAPPAGPGPEKVSRRRFVAGGAVALAAAGAGASFFFTRKHTEARVLRIANWPLYIDDQTVADFTRATGISVDYQEVIEDNDDFLAGVRGDLAAGWSIGYDLVVLTEWMAAEWIFQQWAARFDIRLVPNRVNLLPELAAPSFDPSRLYTLPWMSGMAGIAYDSAMVKEIRTVSQLFDVSRRDKVGALSEMRDTLGIVMLSQGASPEGVTPAQAKAATDKLTKIRRDVGLKIYGTEYTDALLSGEVVATIGWAGDIGALQKEKPSLRWVVPDEGGMLFTDAMVIPKHAENADLAHAFMNFVYRPEQSAQIVRQIPYISPVRGAFEILAATDPDAAASVAVNPTADDRRRLHTFRAMSESMTKDVSAQFATAAGIAG